MESTKKSSRGRRGIIPRESDIQIQLIALCQLAERHDPDFYWIYSYPAGLNLGYTRNSAGRTYSPQGVKARAMGLKKGLPDIIIDLGRNGYRKGWIELKRPGGRPTPEQLQMHERLRANGDWVGVAYSLDEAWQMICEYLGKPLDCWNRRAPSRYRPL